LFNAKLDVATGALIYADDLGYRTRAQAEHATLQRFGVQGSAGHEGDAVATGA